MIGVLGGMGPESTVYTYQQMVSFCQRKYGAKLDSDFPPILIYNIPVPDVVEKGSDDGEVLRVLECGMDLLAKAGASFAIMPCNSMDRFVPELRKRVPMLSIVEETAKEVKSAGFRKVGILATETTIASGVYQKELAKSGIEIVVPKNQELVTDSIRAVLSGEKTAPKRWLLDSVEELKLFGAEGIILGCTDLPLAIGEKDSELRLFDSAKILGESAISKFYERKKRGERYE